MRPSTMFPWWRRAFEQRTSKRMTAWFGFISYSLVTAAIWLPITWLMGRNSPGEFLVGMGVAYIVTGFITPFLPGSWTFWQSPRATRWAQYVLGAGMLFCGLVYHFMQSIVVVGVAYILAVLVGVIGYFRIDAFLHRQGAEAYNRERTAWEQRRREQQVRSRIEYRLRR